MLQRAREREREREGEDGRVLSHCRNFGDRNCALDLGRLRASNQKQTSAFVLGRLRASNQKQNQPFSLLVPSCSLSFILFSSFLSSFRCLLGRSPRSRDIARRESSRVCVRRAAGTASGVSHLVCAFALQQGQRQA
jgi:hypothetical protein